MKKEYSMVLLRSESVGGKSCFHIPAVTPASAICRFPPSVTYSLLSASCSHLAAVTPLSAASLCTCNNQQKTIISRLKLLLRNFKALNHETRPRRKKERRNKKNRNFRWWFMKNYHFFKIFVKENKNTG